jgi:hypothetical protein
MREVVEAVVAAGAIPFYKLDAEQARRQPPASVAAMTVAKQRGLDAKPEVVGDRRHIKVAGQKGQLDAILYRPAGSKGNEAPALPVLVYFHEEDSWWPAQTFMMPLLEPWLTHLNAWLFP